MTHKKYLLPNLFALLFPWIAVILLSSFSAYAQYDSLLYKPYGKNVLGIHAMYKDLIDIQDSTRRLEKAEEIKRFARQHKDRNLELNVDFFLTFWNAFYQNQPPEISLRKLTEQVERYKKEDVEFLYARSLRALAEFYWKRKKNYEQAFEQYLLLEKELAKTTIDDYPEMARDLMQIGEVFYYFQDYAIARKYFQKVLTLPENSFNTMVYNASRNNMGLCFQQENQLDSADYYFNEVLKTSFTEASVWKRIATGNLGHSMYLRQDFDKAIPLLEKDFEGSAKENDLGSAAGASIALADIYTQKRQLKQAGEYIAHAREYIRKAGQPDRLRLLYPIMSKWYAAIGDQSMANQYVDSTVSALNRYNEKYSALSILRAQQKLDRQKEQLQQAKLIVEQERKIAERTLFLLLIALLCIGIVLTYYIHRKRQLAKDLELQKASHELDAAKLHLKQFTESIQTKNRLIEELEHRLDQSADSKDYALVRQLQKSTILTEDDWVQFKSVFEQVHAGFLSRLRWKYPNLSPAETRFLSLAKLNFSTKEMASALGVTTQSIRTNWYRIRKKLELSEEMKVEELVAGV